MTTMITATGAEYHFSSLSALDPANRPVKIEDIAHMLSQINRFHGACKRPYSVAEHSLFVSSIAERMDMPLSMQLCCLMHDAHECFTQDVSSPAKQAINFMSSVAGGTNAWTMFEDQHAKHLRAQFGLSSAFAAHRHGIRTLDLVALATERRDLTAFDAAVHSPWAVLGDGSADSLQIVHPQAERLDTPERAAMAWTDWRDRFQDRFDELTYGIASAHGLDVTA